MPLTPSQLRTIPLLRGISEEFLKRVSRLFEERTLDEGEVLFESGDPASALYLLEKGEITLIEDDKVRIRIHPPAPIGELGALTDLTRNTTATATQPSILWQVASSKLVTFFADHPDVAFPFYQELLRIAADKIQRDQRRIENMRDNIIRTQKAMKRLRDYLLESQDTPISDTLHDTLEELIRHNRRVNYRVEPPSLLPASIRYDDGSIGAIAVISRTHLSIIYGPEDRTLPGIGEGWSGVLRLSGPEFPVSGKVLRVHGNRRVEVELDLLIDEFSAILDGYLTRVQLLDFLV